MNEKHGHPERIVPDDTTSGIVAIHLKRYDFAREQLKGKRVLDVACGVGYGTAYLAGVAAQVVGVDIDQSAIDYAQKRYGDADNVQFFCEDAGDLHFKDASFDAVCSFETIEHMPDVERYLHEVIRVLVSDGLFLVSTPAARNTTHAPKNPHHVQEWCPADFISLLQAHFSSIQVYSQLRRTTRLATLIKRIDVFKLRTKVPLSLTRTVALGAGVQTMGDVDMKDVLIIPQMKNDATEIVAVCRN